MAVIGVSFFESVFADHSKDHPVAVSTSVGTHSPGLLVHHSAGLHSDGFFHVATWVLVLAGSITAIKAWREGRFAPSWSFHFGLILAGWGIFNLVEGVVDHHLLGVHHVRDDVGAPLSWDLGFLAFGALLVVAGWLLHKRGLAAMERRARAMGEGASVGR